MKVIITFPMDRLLYSNLRDAKVVAEALATPNSAVIGLDILSLALSLSPTPFVSFLACLLDLLHSLYMEILLGHIPLVQRGCLHRGQCPRAARGVYRGAGYFFVRDSFRTGSTCPRGSRGAFRGVACGGSTLKYGLFKIPLSLLAAPKP